MPGYWALYKAPKADEMTNGRKCKMKNGRSLMELAQELERQRNAKRDYLLDTRNLEMGFVEAGAYQMMMRNDSKNVSTLLGVGEIAHRQIGSALGIPAKYYDMRKTESAWMSRMRGWAIMHRCRISSMRRWKMSRRNRGMNKHGNPRRRIREPCAAGA